MDSVALLNRVDTKFLTDVGHLLDIMKSVQADYRILEIDGRRKNTYETVYFDTQDLRFYTNHHRGKNNRYKLRQRKYVESDLAFMEVKFKNNKKRTIKNRIEIDGIEMVIDDEALEFVHETSHINTDLQPMLVNGFTRITLVNKNFPERLTIDLGLHFKANNKELQLERTVIIEAKHEDLNRKTPFMRALKERLIRPTRISKYCFGMAMTNEELKQNRFKHRINRIKRIEHGIAV